MGLQEPEPIHSVGSHLHFGDSPALRASGLGGRVRDESLCSSEEGSGRCLRGQCLRGGKGFGNHLAHHPYFGPRSNKTKDNRETKSGGYSGNSK